MGVMELAELKGDVESDQCMASFAIRMCVAKMHAEEGGLAVTRERLLEELRLAIQRRSATCRLEVARALDSGCQWLLMGGLRGAAPIQPVGGFALQWRLHQRAAEALFQGLLEWYNEAGPTQKLASQMASQLDTVFLFDARFLQAMIPTGFSPAKLVLGLHELLVARGMGTGNVFAWLLFRTMYHLFEKSVFSFGAFWEDPAAPRASYGLLEAAEPYRAMCRAVVLECERACPTDLDVELLKVRVPAVSELIQREALLAGGGAEGGYNSAHASFALLRAGEERWGASAATLPSMIYQLGCTCALGFGPMDKYGGLPMAQLTERIKDAKSLSYCLIQEVVAIRSRCRSPRRCAQAVARAVEIVGRAGPIRGTMMEVQRRVSYPPRAGRISRTSEEAVLLWLAFYQRTGEPLFHSPECEAMFSAHAGQVGATDAMAQGPEGVADFMVRAARDACFRYKDPRKLEGAMDLAMEVADVSSFPVNDVVSLVRHRVHFGTRAGMLLFRMFQQADAEPLCPQADHDAVLDKGAQLREEKAVRMCERVAALYASSGVRPALVYARAWLHSRRMGFDRVAHQRAAITAAMRLPEGVPDWHPGVPIAIAEAFRSVYRSPLCEAA